MDRATKLNNALELFKKHSENNGYKIDDMCITEAYSGVSNTSYEVKINADWVSSMNCSQALDIVIDFIWETVDLETRKLIFSINVNGCSESLVCEA